MSLNEPVNTAALTAHQKLLRIWYVIAGVSMLLFFIVFATFMYLSNATGINEGTAKYEELRSLFAWCISLPALTALLAWLLYGTLLKKFRLQAANQFVDDNGWSPSRDSRLRTVPSVLLGGSEDRDQQYKFAGTYKGRKFACQVFEFESGYKSRHFVCVNFELSKDYPPIFLDNKFNNSWRGRFSNLPTVMLRRTPLRLEGDFDNSYLASTTPGNEHRAMYVLSPDIMSVLHDHSKNKVDVEISGKDLFLMYDAEFYTSENITGLFAVADVMLKELNELSRTWMASSPSEERAIALSARATRNKLVHRASFMTAVFIAIAALWAIFALWSRMSQ